MLYDWPSLGSILGDEPDRAHARTCAGQLTDVLSAMFDYLVEKQNAPLVSQAPATDNVWDVDCSSFFPNEIGGEAIHGAYFETNGTIELIRKILLGVDREVLKTTKATQGTTWLPP